MSYFYVDQTDIESYLGITLTGNGLNTFNLLQQSMQDTVDTYCNRSWNFENPVSEYFDAMKSVGTTYFSNYDFFVANPKVSSTVYGSNPPQAGGIVSMTVGTLPVDLNYVINYGSFIRLSASFSSVLLSNPLGFKGIQITYNSDAAQNVPSPVKQALIQWISRSILSSQDGGKETKEVMAGNIRAYFKEDKLGEIPDFCRLVLDKYRLTPVDHF